MNGKDVADHIASCGKACKLCVDANFCDGCRSRNPQMARWQKRDGCFQYICSKRKKLNGCWECAEAPCEKDMFLEELPLRVFVSYAKEEGVDRLGESLFRNQIHGIIFPKAYDKANNEAEIKELLTSYMSKG